MNSKDFLTTKDLVNMYGVSRQTVGIWRLKGLDYTELGPRIFVYDKHKVEQFVKNLRSNRTAKGEWK